MVAWAAVLVCLDLVMIGRTQAAEKAAISLDPPWTTIFRGLTVTLTCNVPGQPETYYWGKDYSLIGNGRTREIRNAEKSDAGIYICKGTNSEISDPVTLTVLNESAEKPLISLNPPWTTIFRGSTVTLMCSVPGQLRAYSWSKDSTWLASCHLCTTPRQLANGRTRAISNADKRDSGIYQCQGTKSEFSDPVILTVSNEWVILQALYYAVFEGDKLRLNCPAWSGSTVTSVRFYKSSEIIQEATTQTFTIEEARTSDSGAYKCEANIKWKGTYTSNTEWINVQVLFTPPKLKTTPQHVLVEGETVTLECYTELNPQKANVELLYSFYKDGELVMKQGSLPEFVITAVGLSDGGDYKCEVQRAYKSVWKQSSSVWVSVRRIRVTKTSLEVWPQSGQAIEKERSTLNCSVANGTGTITFSWCRWDTSTCMNRMMVNATWAEHTIEAMTEKDAGSYYCSASNIKSTAIISSTVQIHVKLRVSKPILTLEADNDGAVVGDTVVIQCSSQRGSAPIKYRFYLQERFLGTVEVNRTLPGRYTMTRVSLNEQGMFYCEADNGIQDGVERSENVTLSIIVPVSGATLRMDRASPEVLVGENLTLTCTVAAGSFPVFNWLHNEKEADEASGMYQLLSPGNSLHIKSVQPEHGGSYVCQARNQVNQKCTFNSTSNIMSITVIEPNNALLIATATLGPLVVIAVIAILLFLFCKQKKKTDDRYFTAPVSNHQNADQYAPVSPSPSVSTDPAPLYSSVSAAASSRNDTDVVYAVIDTKAKRRAPTATLQENLDYYVTYSSVKIERHDKAAGRRDFDEAEESDNLYANFQNK